MKFCKKNYSTVDNNEKYFDYFRNGLLLGLGNPLLDIIARTEHTFLEKYDLKPNDAIIADEIKHKDLYV